MRKYLLGWNHLQRLPVKRKYSPGNKSGKCIAKTNQFIIQYFSCGVGQKDPLLPLENPLNEAGIMARRLVSLVISFAKLYTQRGASGKGKAAIRHINIF